MDLKLHLTALAAYHIWATEHLYLHLNGLSEEDYRADCGLFFKSIHGTLNHLLVADRLWFKRFSESLSPVINLNAEVETNRENLRASLIQETKKWKESLTQPSALPEFLEYTTMRGFPARIPYSLTLAHVFNHGTHHRGQIIAAMTNFGYSSPEIDLVYMLQTLQTGDDE